MDPCKTVEGAGERNTENSEIKDELLGLGAEEFPVCFTRMGMGDLELADLQETQPLAQPLAQPFAQPLEQPLAQPLAHSFCCMEFKPLASDSDEDSKPAASPSPRYVQDEQMPSTSAMGGGPSAWSKLSVTQVSWMSLPPDQVSAATSDDSSEDDDEVCRGAPRGAPTPDNTPEQTPSEELHRDKPHILDILEVGAQSELCASLVTEKLSEPKDRQHETSNTLGKVWSRIMGISSKKSNHHQQKQQPQHQHQYFKSDDDTDSDSSDEAGQDEMSQRIEELEATLEEVRLDGDEDDPVVSYLVEEADEGARLPGKPRGLTVEEVLDDETHPPPAPKASGLLARIFTRSKTCHDVTQPPAAAAAASASKRAREERDDKLLHRILRKADKKRSAKRPPDSRGQPHAAVRSSLPRMLSRLLRQEAAQAAQAGLWGAEGDAGEPMEAVSHSRKGPSKGPPAPALPRSRRPARELEKVLPDETVHLIQQNTAQLRQVADFAGQTEESCFLEYAPIYRRKEQIGNLGVDTCSTTELQKPPDFIDLL